MLFSWINEETNQPPNHWHTWFVPTDLVVADLLSSNIRHFKVRETYASLFHLDLSTSQSSWLQRHKSTPRGRNQSITWWPQHHGMVLQRSSLGQASVRPSVPPSLSLKLLLISRGQTCIFSPYSVICHVILTCSPTSLLSYLLKMRKEICSLAFICFFFPQTPLHCWFISKINKPKTSPTSNRQDFIFGL